MGIYGYHEHPDALQFDTAVAPVIRATRLNVANGSGPAGSNRIGIRAFVGLVITVLSPAYAAGGSPVAEFRYSSPKGNSTRG